MSNKKDDKKYFQSGKPDRKGALKFTYSRPYGDEHKLKPQPVPEKKLKKWQIGEKAEGEAWTRHTTEKMQQQEEMMAAVTEAQARAEMLQTEEGGEIEGECTDGITQHEIKASADELTQQKIFDLRLDQFGPYRLDYTRNGRHLLLGGARGHIAALDWQTKRLHCEINVMETVNDVKWLHQETMFAVAQKRWTYIYDNQGIELHCIAHMDRVQRMEFLHQHFLLVTGNALGFLCYLDVTYGKKVSTVATKEGRLDVMTVNPQNAVIHLGHPNGTMSLWTPNMTDPVAKIMCHGGAVRACAVDSTGRFMATTGTDRKLKVFDLRMYKEVSSFRYRSKQMPGLLDFSQKGILAVSRDNSVELYKDMATLGERPDKPYLYHACDRLVGDLGFCPYEDVLGVGHTWGFSSIVVPGAGEPNYDAFESNPFRSKSQRKQTEVRMLLDKVPAEAISLEGHVGEVDLITAQELQAERNANMYRKPDKIDYTPRHRTKGKSRTGRFENRKKGYKEDRIRKKVKEIVHLKDEAAKKKKEKEKEKEKDNVSALDRFKTRDV